DLDRVLALLALVALLVADCGANAKQGDAGQGGHQHSHGGGLQQEEVNHGTHGTHGTKTITRSIGPCSLFLLSSFRVFRGFRGLTCFHFVTFTFSFVSCVTGLPWNVAVTRTNRLVRLPGALSSGDCSTSFASFLPAGMVTSSASRPLMAGGTTSCTLKSPS